MTTQHYDLLVVGGGMVGLTLALASARAGLSTAIIDNQAPPSFAAERPFDLRVSAINLASQHLFAQLNAWPGIEARRYCPYEKMVVWDSHTSGHIEFDAAELGLPWLGFIIENTVIQQALLDQAQQTAELAWHCPAEPKAFHFDARNVEVSLEDGRRLQARLLVGADGRNSRVRAVAGLGWRAVHYGQTAIVANVITARPTQATAWQRFLPTGPVAFLPLAEHHSAVVWSTSARQANELLALADAAFVSRLERACGRRLGAIEAIGRRASFPLQGAQALRYVDRRVALIGDAAHTIHPLAGQGANLGFLDAAALAEVITVTQHDIGSMRVLGRYARARREHNLLMQRSMEGLQALFGSQLPPLELARSLGLSMVNRTPLAKHFFMRQALGLAGELPPLARP